MSSNSAIQKNASGQFIQQPTDNIILMQKGLWGVSDEHLAKTLNWGSEKFKIELENLVYRHVKCGFSSKSALSLQLKLTEEKIDEMYKNAEIREQGIKDVPKDVAILKSQVALLQYQLQEIQQRMGQPHPPPPPISRQTSWNTTLNPTSVPRTPSAPPLPQAPPQPFRAPVSSGAPKTPNTSHPFVDPNTFNQLYGSPMTTGVFTEKNYHDSNGEWVG